MNNNRKKKLSFINLSRKLKMLLLLTLISLSHKILLLSRIMRSLQKKSSHCYYNKNGLCDIDVTWPRRANCNAQCEQ